MIRRLLIANRGENAVRIARTAHRLGIDTVGVFVRSDEAWPWLDALLTTARFQQLLPETADLVVARHPLPNLRAINFVVPEALLD